MLVVDVETTGLDPRQHSIVALGCVDFQDPQFRFYEECRIWEGAIITPEALAVNGFTVEQVTDQSRTPIEAMIHRFFAWVMRRPCRTVAGSNPAFDMAFLREASLRAKTYWPLGHRTVDLHALAYAAYLRRGLSLPERGGYVYLYTDRCLTYAGLPAEPRPHNALIGALMEAEALHRLIYGRNLLPEYSRHPLPDYLAPLPEEETP